MTAEQRKAKALERADAVRRVLGSADGGVVLELMQDLVVELRGRMQPAPGAPLDAGAAFVAEGAQQQLDNLKFYAEAAERKSDG